MTNGALSKWTVSIQALLSVRPDKQAQIEHVNFPRLAMPLPQTQCDFIFAVSRAPTPGASLL